MLKHKEGKERTVYAKMLGNIASDLDSMRTDLQEKQPVDNSTHLEQQLPVSTVTVDRLAPDQGLLLAPPAPTAPSGLPSADTIGKDSFLSPSGCASYKQHGHALGSSVSLLNDAAAAACGSGPPYASDINISSAATDGGLHSRSAGTHPELDVESSVDSGHAGTGGSRSRTRGGPDMGEHGELGEHPTVSPLLFDPQHFSGNSPLNLGSVGARVVVDMSSSTDEFRPISTLERLVKTNSIWLLASLSRAGAVHILKDRATGNFIIRKSSQPHSLALSVQSRLCGHPAVDHYLIQGSTEGFRLEGSAHFFHSIPALISYYIDNIDEIPYHLQLPVAIQQARSTRELASLDMLGQDFWSSSLSRKVSTPTACFLDGGHLHKSHSEPINIQKHPASSNPQDHLVNNTPPSRSTEGFSHFMQSQTDLEKHFTHPTHSSLSPFSRDQESLVSNEESTPLLQVTTAVVVSLPNSLSKTSKTSLRRTPPSVPSEFSTPPQFCRSPQKERFHMKCSSSPEPLYSVSKKQLQTSQCAAVAVATECDGNSNRRATGNHPDTTSSLAYEVSALTLQQHGLPQAVLAGEDNPYRCSTSNKLASPVPSSSQKGENETNSTTGGKTFVPRPKANLYFTTNLNLLEIPDNSYFTSNLSDRLSDYEDIWRTSSCPDSDQDHYHRHNKKQFQGSTTRMISDPRSVMDARFNLQQQQQPQQPLLFSPKEKVMSIPSVSTNTGKRKVLRKTSRDSPVSRRIPAERDAVTGGTTGLTALEQARKIAGSTSDEDGIVSPTFYPHHQPPPPPVAHVKGIRRSTSVYDYEDEEDTNQDDSHQHEQQQTESSPHAAIAVPTSGTTTTNKNVAVVTNTNSIQILPSRPNQIKFVTSHSLDFNTVSAQPENSTTQAASSMILTPTPTSSQSLPASIARGTTQTCVFTTTMAVHVAQASNNQHPLQPSLMTRITALPSDTSAKNSNAIPSDTSAKNSNKTKEKANFISPLSRLSRLKSSSESSLATVSSPLYAEPADAVKLRDKHGKAINIQIRRQSAPSGPQQLLAAARNKDRQQHPPSSKVSQNPRLDTILSPGVLASDKMAATENSNKFTFEDVNAWSNRSEFESCNRPSLARSHSLRTPCEQNQFQRKQSWKERLNRLKLGTRVLTRNLTPPSAPSARKNQFQKQMSAQSHDNNDQTCPHLTTQVPPSPNSPGKFPVLGNSFFDPRASIFSESSTVQDLISCAHPELSVRPIANVSSRQMVPHANELCRGGLQHEAPTAPSEYDNLGIYRTSTHSSVGTVYLPPWEISATSRLMQGSPQPRHSSHQEITRSSSEVPPPLPSQPPLQQLSTVVPRLAPAMSYQERVARWHQSNTTYLHHQQANVSVSPSTAARETNTASLMNAGQSRDRIPGQRIAANHNTLLLTQHDRFLQQQQQQLLHHQRQVKNNDKNNNGRNQDGEILHKQKDFQDSSHCEPLPPLSPVSPISSNLANSVHLSTALNVPTSVTLTSSPTVFSSSASPSSPHRLSSHCPDVVHCHSTPIPLTPTSCSSSLLRHGGESAEVTTAHMIGEDDVLFGGSFTMASPELQRQISPILSQEISNHQDNKAPGTRIREYIFKLSSDHQTIFGSTIENFIQCTLESQETNPDHVMRNVRQFMTGIKNYLVKHGEGMLEDLIERERNKLGANEILNIDAIIEQALHVCVLKPLKYHIYHLFVEKYNSNGALEQLSRNIKYARTKSAEDLGVKPGLKVPGHIDMEVIKYYLDLMQRSYSPLQKLQNLLKATSTIYHCVQGKHQQFPSRGPSSLGADDFLPMLIYVLVHCGLVAAEIEADFMWGLLQQSLLTGEGGYYLTTLSSAVLVLKNFQETHDIAPTQHEGQLPTLSDMQGFLKIAIPDELHHSINWKTLPVRPNMNTKDVCALVAHKFKVTNPQDYGLFLLCDGQESQMAEGDCPQVVKGDYLTLKKTCFFAFKRLDANIAWPKQIQESTLTDTM